MNYTIHRNIPYLPGSNNPRHQLDIYSPDIYHPDTHADTHADNPAQEKLPTIIYLHGGGWEHGDKEKATERLHHFYDTGYILIAIGYRLSDEATWPAPIDDAAAALKFIQTQIPSVDPSRIALWGSSAGGHLACLLAGGCRQPHMPTIRCIVNYCAPVTLSTFVHHLTGPDRHHSPVMKLLGGDHENTDTLAHQATVTTWIRPGYPTTLSIHGDKDDIVPMQQSQILTHAIQAVGSKAQLIIAKNTQHRVENPQIRQTVKDFLAKNL